jgi:hypothetical protein
MGLDRDEKLNAAELKLFDKLEKLEARTDAEEESYQYFKKQKAVAEKSLSKTCISYLREEIFIYMKYGERIRPGGESLFESATRIMKGSMMEGAAIEMLAAHDGINYKKNRRKFRNKWVSGYPDINYKKRLGDRKVIDIKCSWDLYTFMGNIPKSVSAMNRAQIQGYISLTKADIGEVCHVLVSAPDELIEKQVAKLRYKNVFATVEEFENAANLTRRSMKFDDIPEERRIIRFPVNRSDEDQKIMFERVDLCRDWLVQYQVAHEELFKKK